jgi:predicted Zn-dependent protease
MESGLKFDGFDKLHISFLVLLLVAVGTVLTTGSRQADAPVQNRALERALSIQARLLFIQNTYGQVESLLQEGRHQEALLKLEELASRYQGEAHGLLLKAVAQAALGAQGPAISSYAAAVRLQGEYVDHKSPLSRRAEIIQTTENGLAIFTQKLKAQPGDVALKQTLRDLYYLKSRLAGGCE